MAGQPTHRPDLVIPTIGRSSLFSLLDALAAQTPLLGRIYVIDDRRVRNTPLPIPSGVKGVTVLTGPARGPAAARNTGWRAAGARWVIFLDDDVLPPSDWAEDLLSDLEDLPPSVAASQGNVRVPLPRNRRPTDWERNVAALQQATWITADMALRREALKAADGFDERFRRAYREDTDLALRLLRGGWQIAQGRRQVAHPVPLAGFWTSVRLQRGNADDVLMRALHGPDWRTWGQAPRGRIGRHFLFTGLAAASLAAITRRKRLIATAGGIGAVTLWADLAAARIRPGPRDAEEIVKMAVTSVPLPIAATASRIGGLLSLPRRLASADRSFRADPAPRPRPAAILFDRDGTLVFDVPYNGDPARVKAIPGTSVAIRRLRELEIPIAVVSNQSGIGRRLIGPEQVRAVNRRIDELLGPFGAWLFCPHSPDAGCSCRKPAPGLVIRAAAMLGVPPEHCLVVGDIAADVQAAQAAGAAAVLIPNGETEHEDIAQSPWVASSLESVVDTILAEVER